MATIWEIQIRQDTTKDGIMNKAMCKLDSTIQDWRLWLKDMEMDIDWDNLDDKSTELVANQVDKIKDMLNQRGADSLYFKGLRKHMEFMHSDDDDPQLTLW